MAFFNTLTQRQKSRLARLAEVMASVDPATYNQRTVVIEPSDHHPCGTVACVFGQAILSERFPGLNLWWCSEKLKVVGLGENFYNSNWGVITDSYFGKGVWDALCEFNSYDSPNPTVSDVINKIKLMIADKI